MVKNIVVLKGNESRWEKWKGGKREGGWERGKKEAGREIKREGGREKSHKKHIQQMQETRNPHESVTTSR